MRYITFFFLILFVGYNEMLCQKNVILMEIDSLEFSLAEKHFSDYNIEMVSIQDQNELKKEFMYKLFEYDKEVKFIYDCSFEAEEFIYEFKCFDFNNDVIYVMEFTTPIKHFLYMATVSPTNTLNISYVKIDAMQYVISKTGLIAGFKDTIDAFYVDSNIYQLSVDRHKILTISKIFHFYNRGKHWCVDDKPRSTLWYKNALYIHGRLLIKEDVQNCFFKLCR